VSVATALVTPEVETELRRASTKPELGELRLLIDHSRWPTRVAPLSLELQREALLLRRAIALPGDHAAEHIGEISTVLAAVRDRTGLVIMDDREGRALARARGVSTMPTAVFAAQLVAEGLLEEDEGLLVFLTTRGTTTAAFDARLSQIRNG